MDRDEHGLEIVEDEPLVQGLRDVNTMFFQFIEYGLEMRMKPSREVVDGLSGTF